MERIFEVNNLAIPYTIAESKRSSYLRLEMGFQGLKVVKPVRVSLREVERLLETKRNWILKHYQRFQAGQAAQPQRFWKTGESLLYRGQSYPLRFFNHPQEQLHIALQQGEFHIFLNPHWSAVERKTFLEQAFRLWFKQKAEVVIRERLAYFCRRSGFTFNTLRIKEQKTRWGSCSHKGNLNFNWKLLMAPPWILDYIVIHEICHLKYLNHSRDFWQLVEQYMPNYREAEAWLKKNGNKLRL